MKRVFRAASLIQVAHARNVLLSAGIQSELRNQYLAGAAGDLPMLETWPQLFVEDGDEALALKALASAAQAPAGPNWSCPECGEVLEPQFTQCWRCGSAP
ncbi:MAG TPA: DUF2007 domain-containing protein [Steroidobacteraceae bacterium]|jgi:hypothetical protein